MVVDGAFRLLTEVVYDKDKNTYMLFSRPELIYTPHKVLDRIPSYDDVVKYKPDIYEDDRFMYIHGPVRVGTGVFLMIDDFAFFTLRDSYTKYYPNRLNDFAGHVDSFESVINGAFREFYEEVVIYDRKSRSLIVPIHKEFKKVIDLSSYITTAHILTNTMNININVDDIKYVDIVLNERFFDDIPTIKFYDGCKLVESGRGFVVYDGFTNAIEVVIPLYIDDDISNYNVFVTEPFGSPSIAINYDSFVNMKDYYFTRRVVGIRRMIKRGL